MNPFGDDDIAQLLRVKRYEQPPASYYDNFLSEFRRRQRDELLRQLARADFVNVRWLHRMIRRFDRVGQGGQ